MNLFELYAEQTKPRHEIRRERTAAKRRSRREIAALQERSRREKAYRQEVAMAFGELEPEAQALLVDLDLIAATGKARAFLDRLEEAMPRLGDQRHLLLAAVGRLITATREARGLVPFDDPVFDQPPRLFQHVKALLDPEAS
jgi:hypothetical protein